MSRVGKNPIAIPAGTTVTVDGQTIKAKGKLGERQMRLADSVGAEVVDGQLVVLPKSRPERHRMMWGTMRSLAQSLVTGVTEGFTKNLEINGVGYRAQVEGKSLKLQLGFSHDVIYPIPEGIEIKCERPTAVTISGADKQRVGQIAAEIRAYRPPEPYKGKGVKYAEEHIFRKEGKKK
ncbi:MAG: 50S ribosomal protein L6 [Alphaproteobacteria bacterium]|jgi:large subunit ribosomal protein L6